MTQVRVGIFGQSIAQALMHDAAQGVFTQELARAGYTPDITFAAWGGSSMLKANAPVGHSNWYWWDEDANASGPLLISALATIGAASNKPEVILWLQGEGDAVRATSKSAYKSAGANVFNALSAACGTGVPVYIDVLTRRPRDNPPAYAPTPEDADQWSQVIREAQLELIADGTAKFLLEKYDIPIFKGDPLGRWPENYHPPSFGDGILGYRAAQAVLSYLGQPYVEYPVASVARASSNSVTVTIDYPAPLILPDDPAYFAVRPSLDGLTGNIDAFPVSLDTYGIWQGDDLTISRSANVYTITCPKDIPDGSGVLFPYGALAEFDPSLIVRDMWGQPLRSFAATV